MSNNFKKVQRKVQKIWLKNKMQFKHFTSISDNDLYPEFCLKASIHQRIFNTFRRNLIYQQILEHLNHSQGLAYLNEIKKDPEFIKKIESFKRNDLYGGAELSKYDGIGDISPSTLRYVKVYFDLINLFGSLDNLNICEIGVGYGGQCRIINADSKPKKFTLVDIKSALELTQKYLDYYIIPSTLEYKTMNELSTQSYDLVISNYAFTELPRSFQEVYLERVILNSTKGYITYNDISPDYFNSIKKEELVKIIPGSKIIEEIPLTHPKNCVIIWGN
jgi:putative sugar O-methyltransferase